MLGRMRGVEFETGLWGERRWPFTGLDGRWDDDMVDWDAIAMMDAVRVCVVVMCREGDCERIHSGVSSCIARCRAASRRRGAIHICKSINRCSGLGHDFECMHFTYVTHGATEILTRLDETGCRQQGIPPYRHRNSLQTATRPSDMREL